jgi:telomerase reverse transcriptase
VKTAVLAQYYPRVVSLREYLLSKLPSTSKIRRKKIQTVGRNIGGESCERYQVLAEVLDTTLVGVLRDGESSREERWQQWTSFSQKADISVSTLANTTGIGLFSQPDVSRY